MSELLHTFGERGRVEGGGGGGGGVGGGGWGGGEPMILERGRCVEFCHISSGCIEPPHNAVSHVSSGWFDYTEPFRLHTHPSNVLWSRMNLFQQSNCKLTHLKHLHTCVLLLVTSVSGDVNLLLLACSCSITQCLASGFDWLEAPPMTLTSSLSLSLSIIVHCARATTPRHAK